MGATHTPLGPARRSAAAALETVLSPRLPSASTSTACLKALSLWECAQRTCRAGWKCAGVNTPRTDSQRGGMGASGQVPHAPLPSVGVLPKRASPCLREACGIKASCLLWQPTHLLSWLPSLACLTSPPLHCASWDNLQSQIKHRTMDRGLLLRKLRRRACKVIELTSHSNERTMKDQEPLLVRHFIKVYISLLF